MYDGNQLIMLAKTGLFALILVKLRFYKYTPIKKKLFAHSELISSLKHFVNDISR